MEVAKCLSEKANREDSDPTASSAVFDIGLHCLPRPFWYTTCVVNLQPLQYSYLHQYFLIISVL